MIALLALAMSAQGIPDHVTAYYRILKDDLTVGLAFEERMGDSLRGWSRRQVDGVFVVERHDPASVQSWVGGAFTELMRKDGESWVTMPSGLQVRLFPGKEISYRHPALMLHAMTAAGRLDRPGRVTAKLEDPYGRSQLPVDVAFVVGEERLREAMGRQVRLRPLKIERPWPAPFESLETVEAWIDRYGRIVESVDRGGRRLVLVQNHDGVHRERVLGLPQAVPAGDRVLRLNGVENGDLLLDIRNPGPDALEVREVWNHHFPDFSVTMCIKGGAWGTVEAVAMGPVEARASGGVTACVFGEAKPIAVASGEGRSFRVPFPTDGLSAGTYWVRVVGPGGLESNGIPIRVPW